MNIIRTLAEVVVCATGYDKIVAQRALDSALKIAGLIQLQESLSESDLRNRLGEEFWGDLLSVRGNVTDFWGEYTERHLISKYLK
jgi:hypothetical protein